MEKSKGISGRQISCHRRISQSFIYEACHLLLVTESGEAKISTCLSSLSVYIHVEERVCVLITVSLPGTCKNFSKYFTQPMNEGN